MDTKKIGEFLKILRKEKGLTQEQLAEILYVSGRTVSRWETGNNMPELSVLIQMAEFYGIEIKEILNGERKSGKSWKYSLRTYFYCMCSNNFSSVDYNERINICCR